MNSAHSDGFELLLEEYLDLYRQGTNPSVEQFADQHPAHASQLKEYLPAVIMIEGLAPGSQTNDAENDAPCLDDAADLVRLGDYQIIRELARGGMGIVYEAEQLSLKRRVALKVLSPGVVDQRYSERFQREAQAAANLHHTNIVPVFEVGEEGSRLFYAMQFIRGAGLDEVINELRAIRKRPDLLGVSDLEKSDANSGKTGFNATPKPVRFESEDSPDPPKKTASNKAVESITSLLSVSDLSNGSSGDSQRSGVGIRYCKTIATMGAQVADALAYAHEHGVLHRDIKPANLLLDMAGSVWITDFGLARTDGEENLTRSCDIIGTVRYMAPEAFQNKTDARSEVYALGVTLYELLVLQPAFHDSNRFKLIQAITHSCPVRLRVIDRSIPADLETILEKAFDREPNSRYANASELAKDLRRFLDDAPILARKVGYLERTTRWSRRNRALATMMTSFLILLMIMSVGATIAAIHFSMQEDVQRELAADNHRLAGQRENQRQAAVSARDEATESKVQAEQRAEQLRQTLYYSQMNLAANAAASPYGLETLRRRLDLWQPEGENADIRGWEWFYYRSFLDRHANEMSFITGRRRIQIHPDSRLFCYSTDGSGGWGDLQTSVSVAGAMDAVCMTEDGSRLAVVNLGAADVVIYDFETMAEVRRLPITTGSVKSMAWSSDGQRLAVASKDAFLIFGVKESEPIAKVAGDFEQNHEMHWRPVAGHDLVATVGSGRVVVFDGNTADVVIDELFKVELSDSSTIAWHPKQAWLAVSCDNGASERWGEAQTHVLRLKNGSLTRQEPVQGSRGSWSPDGAVFATGGAATIRLWDGLEFTTLGELPGHGGAVRMLAWSGDGSQLASASLDRTARIWDVASGKCIRTLRGHHKLIGSVAWTPDQSQVVTFGFNGLLKTWDVSKPSETLVLVGAEESDLLSRVCWSHDGEYLAAVGRDAPLRVWHTSDGSLSATYEDGRAAAGLDWNQQHQQFVTAAHLGRVKYWGVGGTPGKTLADRYNSIDLAVSPDQTRIALSQNEPHAFILDASSGEQIAEFSIGTERTLAVAWHPDNRRLAVACYFDEAEIWDVEASERIFTLRGHTASLKDVAWSPDGSLLATASQDTTVRIWNGDTGEAVAVLEGHGHRVNRIAWSPDGKRLASASYDESIHIWDTVTWQSAVSMPQPGPVTGLAWGPNGIRLALCCENGHVRILDASHAMPAEIYPGVSTITETAQMSGSSGQSLSLLADTNAEELPVNAD